MNQIDNNFADYKTAFSEEFAPLPQKRSPSLAAEALNREYQTELQQAAKIDNARQLNPEIASTSSQDDTRSDIDIDRSLISVESQAINALGYHEPSQTLRVEYQNGSQYDYQQITPNTIERLQEAESLGRFINQEIKGNFTAELAESQGIEIETFSIPLEQQQKELTDIALSLTQPSFNLTNSAEINVSQIGKFQIWRDEQNLAVINAGEGEVLVYSDLQQDFFPQTLASSQIATTDPLWSKITSRHPDLKLADYKTDLVTEAWQKFQPQDTLNRVVVNSSTIPQKIVPSANVQNILQQQLAKLPQQYDRTQKWLQKIVEDKPLQAIKKQSSNWIRARTQDVAVAIQKNQLASSIATAFKLNQINHPDQIQKNQPLELNDYFVVKHPTNNNLILKNKQDRPLTTIKLDSSGKISLSEITSEEKQLQEIIKDLQNYNQLHNPHTLQKKLVKAVRQKWQEGYRSSKEDTFTLGDYQITKLNDTFYLQNSKSKHDSTVIAFEQPKNWLSNPKLHPKSWQNNNSNPLEQIKVFQKALTALENPSLKPQGIKQSLRQGIILKSYNAFLPLAQTTKKQKIGMGSYLFHRDRHKFRISDRQGAMILSYRVDSDSAGNNAFKLLSTTNNLQKLQAVSQQLNNPLIRPQSDSELKQQQDRVNSVAPLLAEYLNFQGKTEFNTEIGSLKYDSTSQTLSYQNHVESGEKLFARWNGRGWIDVGSTLSEEKTQQFTTQFAEDLERAKSIQTRQTKQSSSKVKGFSR